MICIDCRLISAPGIGTYLKSLLKPLSIEKRFTLILLCFSQDVTYLSSFGQCIEVKSPIYSLKEQWELPLKIPKCDLFWSPHFSIPLLPIRTKKRMTTIHDVYHLAFFKTLPWKQKLYAKMMYHAAVSISDCIVTVSQFTAQELHRYVKCRPKKLEIISNGIDLRNRPSKRKNFVLAVGNAKAHKNLHRLEVAVKELNLELVIVGKNFNCVSDETLISLYGQAALLVFPSLYEGFGYPPLEAMAQGCPVVASNLGSISEVCGNAAEYVNPFDIESIKKGITKVFYDRDYRDKLVQEGFSRVKKFSLCNTVDQYIRVILENCNCP